MRTTLYILLGIILILAGIWYVNRNALIDIVLNAFEKSEHAYGLAQLTS